MAQAARIEESLRKPATWPEWQPEILRTSGPETLEAGDVVTGRARMLGFDVDGQSVAVEVGPGVFEQHSVVGVGMTIRYELARGTGGVMITHRLVSDLPRGPLGVLLSVFLKRRLSKMQKEVLRRLKLQAEASSS